MNRRQFLSFASVPIAAAVVVPELTRTIFLPPRGGWWGWDTSRYFTSPTAWYLKDHLVPYPIRYGDRVMRAAEFRRILQPGLEQVFREAYAQGVLLEDGTRAKLVEDWAEIFA